MGWEAEVVGRGEVVKGWVVVGGVGRVREEVDVEETGWGMGVGKGMAVGQSTLLWT